MFQIHDKFVEIWEGMKAFNMSQTTNVENGARLLEWPSEIAMDKSRILEVHREINGLAPHQPTLNVSMVG